MENTYNLLLELDKLKSVYRKSYISSEKRYENSAEHCWHIATALMALEPYIPEGVDIDRAIRMALLHDVCEIGAGETYSRTENYFKGNHVD